MAKVRTITVRAEAGETRLAMWREMIRVALQQEEDTGIQVEGTHADYPNRSWFVTHAMLLKAITEDLPF